MIVSDILAKCKIGDRIECGGYYGTIKYIGPIQGKAANWLGIDWDNPERGKHNGNVDNVQYFITRYSTSGSFVRPSNVNLGRSVADAIISRYSENEDEVTAQINRQKQLKLKQTMNAPFLEMVGFEKVFHMQSDLNLLKIANIRFQDVCSVGDLSTICPNIMELDVSKNLLSNWLDIFEICQELTNLVWLNVSENALSIPDNYYEFNFPNVNVLVCGNMHVNWEDCIKISQVFSNIEEFRCPFNDIVELIPTNVFKNLKQLDLEGNLIEKWSEVCKLGSIETLEFLILENINLKSIEFDGVGKLSIFRKLRKLCISNNLISDWNSVGELNRLQNLENLKINRNPIFEIEDKATVLQLIIAKIANLKVLNGVPIEISERRGAEYDYIKKYGLEWLSVKNNEKCEEFLKSHNRYLELIEIYGELEEDELVMKPKTIESSSITVNLIYENNIITKKLPLSITVQKLMILAQKMFHLDRRPTLKCINSENPEIEVILDDELKDIAIYSIENGDQIIINDE